MEVKGNQIILVAGDNINIIVKEQEQQEEPIVIDVPTEEYQGTDNAGKDKDPIILNYTKGDSEGDSLYVNNVIIQEKSNWCKCEIIANGHALKYTALENNPTNEERITYFEHKTTDELLIAGPNVGKPAMKSWIVTVKQKANPNIKEETNNQQDDDPSKLGKYQYSVGLVSDLHICKANDKSSPNDADDDWWDEEDFKASMSVFVNDKNVKFVSSCGDIAESQTNDATKHPESTAEADYAEFIEMYDVPYWQVEGLRFFSPLGNHDFYGIFESRSGDTITKKKNSECILGYNSGVNSRLGNWVTGQQVNGIVPSRGRIVFDLENGKSTANGQADMRFFSFNDYVDLYTREGGYTGDSIWDSKKGGISDDAIKYAKKYVNNNWDKVKDNLIMWNNGGGHGRNGYSKLNYWMTKGNDIFIYLSVNYGDDIWGIKDGWHDRMIHARTIIDLNEDDPYIKRMKEYVSDTGYSSYDEKYNYQYYSPNTLIWLKEIIENNTNKKIYVFTHHSLPNKVGNGAGIPQNGDWQYAVISKAGELTSEGINKGSNMLTGIEYWFLNKLNNKYKNVIWFSGHSHISWDVDCHFVNKDYEIVSPSKQNEFVYSKANNNYKTTSAWNVALPSMSKPRYIGTNGKSSRLYDDAELGIMEIYENGVKIKGYKVKEKNKDVFDKNKPTVEKTIILLNN